jgi:hypothetical protein
MPFDDGFGLGVDCNFLNGLNLISLYICHEKLKIKFKLLKKLQRPNGRQFGETLNLIFNFYF